jgi:hypothetical protein
MQAAQVAAHQAKLAELQAALATLSRAHSLENVVKMAEVSRRQVTLEQKVFALMKHVHLLRNKGYPVREEEEALRAKLVRVQQELLKPGLLQARIHELQLLLSRAGVGEPQGQLEMAEEDADKLLAILQAHKAALSQLTDRVYKVGGGGGGGGAWFPDRPMVGPVHPSSLILPRPRSMPRRARR